VLNLIRSLSFAATAFVRTRRQLAFELLASRHQLGVLKRFVKRPRLSNVDRVALRWTPPVCAEPGPGTDLQHG